MSQYSSYDSPEYSIIAEPQKKAPKHKCSREDFSSAGRRAGWAKYTLIECKGCGKEYYFYKGLFEDFFTVTVFRVRWYNRRLVEKRSGFHG